MSTSEADLRRQAEFEALMCKKSILVNTLEVLAAQIVRDTEQDVPMFGPAQQRINEFNATKEALEHLSTELRSL